MIASTISSATCTFRSRRCSPRPTPGIATTRGPARHLHERAAPALREDAAADAEDVEDARQERADVCIERVWRRLVNRPAEARRRRDRVDDEVDVAHLVEDPFDVVRVRRVTDKTDRVGNLNAQPLDRLAGARDTGHAPAARREVARKHAAEIAGTEDE